MRLYTNRFAPSPRRVRMFAAEKGLALELVEIDIAAGAHHGDDFLRVNPLGEVPVLELADGSRIAQSLAICRWLEEQQPEPPLFGATPRENASINECVDRLMFRLYVPMVHVFRHTHPFWASRLEQVPAWGELQRRAVESELAMLETGLAGGDYLVGERFSMADIVAYTSIDFGKPSDVRLGDAHPNLRRWYQAVNARASARA